jgi:hypothetical protein
MALFGGGALQLCCLMWYDPLGGVVFAVGSVVGVVICGSILARRCLFRFDPLGAPSLRFDPFEALSLWFDPLGASSFAVRSWRVHDVAQEERPEERVGGNARTH